MSSVLVPPRGESLTGVWRTSRESAVELRRLDDGQLEIEYDPRRVSLRPRHGEASAPR